MWLGRTLPALKLEVLTDFPDMSRCSIFQNLVCCACLVDVDKLESRYKERIKRVLNEAAEPVVLSLDFVLDSRFPAHILEPVCPFELVVRLVQSKQAHLLDSSDQVLLCEVFSCLARAQGFMLCFVFGLYPVGTKSPKNAFLALCFSLLGHLLQHFVLVET